MYPRRDGVAKATAKISGIPEKIYTARNGI